MTSFLNFGSPIICLEWMKLGHFKFDVLTDIDEIGLLAHA